MSSDVLFLFSLLGMFGWDWKELILYFLWSMLSLEAVSLEKCSSIGILASALRDDYPLAGN